MATQGTQPVVAVQALTKVFKDFWLRSKARAVDNVSFEVHPGEVFGLLGPNGSGKSTTIKIMLGLLRQTSGRVLVFNKLPTDVATKKRIGYLPEESYLYPFLDARETLDYYAKLFQLDRSVRKSRIDELLDMVGLAAVQHRAVREYSKGMQRRIGIAQALINDPDLLILDEPTTGLDPLGTRQIKDLILGLGRRGKTIILSSHLLADVEDCVDRMVILYGGTVQRQGTCDELLTVSSGRVIETDDVDDATVDQIDRLIRERSGGRHAISRVRRPRQSLESLFVDIVNEAQAKRLATSGASHDGRTAAFLRAGDEADEPNRLIASLVAPDPDAAPAPPAPAAAATAAAAGPDASLIGSLLTAVPGPVPAPAKPTPSAAPATSVDQSVISSLLDGDANRGGRP
ncbi:MAG: ABC transporter ATP-binding protein [Phycisphaerales bacterium]